MYKIEEKGFTPTPLRSKFAKKNSKGQIAKDCIHFSFCGKHCRMFVDVTKNLDVVEKDCVVLKGEYCDTFK